MKFNVFLLAIVFFAFTACNRAQKSVSSSNETQEMKGEMVNQTSSEDSDYIVSAEGEKIPKDIKSNEEWKELLTAEQYYILREEGTERAFTGALLDNKKTGVYYCAACQLPLYSSKTKFKSGTGWPSFYESIDKNFVAEKIDNSYGMRRVEVECARCNGHLGHVFDDGPPPTGMRHCINSAALGFKEGNPNQKGLVTR